MLHRIHCLVVLAALLALVVAPAPARASPAPAVVVVAPSSNSTDAPAFQLNLAKRISTTVKQLRERRSPTKTSRVGLAGARKRTFSDELLDLIKGVSNAFAASSSSSASASPRPSHALAGKPSPSPAWASHAALQRRNYNNGPSAAYPTATASAGAGAQRPGASQAAHAQKPGASQVAHAQKPGASQAAHAQKPGASQAAHGGGDKGKPGASQAASASHSAPSHGASQHAQQPQPQPSALYDARGKAEKVWDYVKRAIREEPWETLDSRLLCPVGEQACPIFPRMGTYECLDTRSELESCGGCTSKGHGEDCTAIRGAQGVTCESGACHVYTCQVGWQLDAGFRREKGGKGRCRKVRSAAAAAAAVAHDEREVVLGGQGLEARDEGVSGAVVEAQ
ncbi:hypothetical protein JCM3775_002714 [Rhodotorula graminis]